MMEKGNPIISTGQVLMRRASIPGVWMENIMETNCADDYLLWLCMAKSLIRDMIHGTLETFIFILYILSSIAHP